MTNREIFDKVYSEGLWNSGAADRPHSGSGSHDSGVVEPYVEAMLRLLDRFAGKVTLVDLGCGDFQVGSRLVAHVDKYFACDVSDRVIEWNRKTYAFSNVEFATIDIGEDELPAGDIACVRQVLQHLSNSDIRKFVAQVNERKPYRFLVVSEHLPQDPDFSPNLDKPSGPNIRVGLGSGIDISAAPFNLRHVASEILCEVKEVTGGRPAIIRTTCYEL